MRIEYSNYRGADGRASEKEFVIPEKCVRAVERRNLDVRSGRVIVRKRIPDQRAADGSSLTKVPAHVRNTVSGWADQEETAMQQNLLNLILS